MSNLNLLPESYVRQRYRNRINMLCVVVFGLLISVLIVLEPSSRKKHKAVMSELDITKKNIAAAQSRQNSLNIDIAKLNKKAEELRVKATYLSDKPASFYLDKIMNIQAKNIICINDIRFKRKNAPLSKEDKALFAANRKAKQQIRANKGKKGKDKKVIIPPLLPALNTYMEIQIDFLGKTELEVSVFVENLRRSGIFTKHNIESRKKVKNGYQCMLTLETLATPVLVKKDSKLNELSEKTGKER